MIWQKPVLAVADHLGISKFHLAGHSMGGYVTMAFREAYPEMLYSYTLFHSNCFPDSDEKKAARSREIELVKQGKKATHREYQNSQSFCRR